MVDDAKKGPRTMVEFEGKNALKDLAEYIRYCAATPRHLRAANPFTPSVGKVTPAAQEPAQAPPAPVRRKLPTTRWGRPGSLPPGTGIGLTGIQSEPTPDPAKQKWEPSERGRPMRVAPGTVIGICGAPEAMAPRPPKKPD